MTKTGFAVFALVFAFSAGTVMGANLESQKSDSGVRFSEMKIKRGNTAPAVHISGEYKSAKKAVATPVKKDNQVSKPAIPIQAAQTVEKKAGNKVVNGLISAGAGLGGAVAGAGIGALIGGALSGGGSTFTGLILGTVVAAGSGAVIGAVVVGIAAAVITYSIISN